MKKIAIIIGSVVLIFGMLFSSSCSDMLDTDSDRFVSTGDNKLDSANDTLYSLVGILKQLQEVGDRYVVLGEVRGDLMALTENADLDLQAINNFTATADNPYVTSKEYYAIINNCNYFIQNVDTSVVAGGVKVLLKEYAAIKGIRAWTYMQIALNYGKAIYFENPILTLEDMEKDYPSYDMIQLADKLIEDLLPYEDVDFPRYSIWNGSYSLFPLSFLLGELYLWKGEGFYEMAAQKYYNLISKKRYNILGGSNISGSDIFQNRWLNSSFDSWRYGWGDMFFNWSSEIITTINYTYEYGRNSNIYNLTRPLAAAQPYEYKLAPSQVAIDMWDNEIYTYYDSDRKIFTYNNGDLRGTSPSNSMSGYSASYERMWNQTGDSVNAITKYLNAPRTPSIYIYRAGILYLRYAEAVNLAGKPSLAFAVLKHGLHPETIADQTIPSPVSPSEVNPLPTYANFSFLESYNKDYIIGIHERGSGDASMDSLYYMIPELETKSDSIRFVDQMIFNELGLETAFEGHRFHDLMRFAIRRDDNNFLADRVGKKNPAVAEKLRTRSNWYLPIQ